MTIPFYIKKTAYNLFLLQSHYSGKGKSIVLFGAWFGERIADNPRFLYQHLFDNKEKYGLTHVVWVTRKEEVYQLMDQMGYYNGNQIGFILLLPCKKRFCHSHF